MSLWKWKTNFAATLDSLTPESAWALQQKVAREGKDADLHEKLLVQQHARLGRPFRAPQPPAPPKPVDAHRTALEALASVPVGHRVAHYRKHRAEIDRAYTAGYSMDSDGTVHGPGEQRGGRRGHGALVGVLLLVAGLGSCTAYADWLREEQLTVTSGSTAAALVATTNTSVRGWLEEIEIDAPTVTAPTFTGTVVVVALPVSTTMSELLIYSNATLTADTRLRPRFDGTDTAGSGLTSDDPWRLCTLGRGIVLRLSACSRTNRTLKASVKIEGR
jgi:hypothetical protein